MISIYIVGLLINFFLIVVTMHYIARHVEELMVVKKDVSDMHEKLDDFNATMRSMGSTVGELERKYFDIERRYFEIETVLRDIYTNEKTKTPKKKSSSSSK